MSPSGPGRGEAATRAWGGGMRRCATCAQQCPGRGPGSLSLRVPWVRTVNRPRLLLVLGDGRGRGKGWLWALLEDQQRPLAVFSKGTFPRPCPHAATPGEGPDLSPRPTALHLQTQLHCFQERERHAALGPRFPHRSTEGLGNLWNWCHQVARRATVGVRATGGAAPLLVPPLHLRFP